MSIWNVLKSDLAEFVSTVKVDAVEKVSTVATSVAKPDGQSEEKLIEPKSSLAYAPPRSWFMDDVDDSTFAAFRSKFDAGVKTADISQRLQESPPLTAIHAELVPTHISYAEFWERFYFNASKLAKPSMRLEDENSDEELGWDADDGEDGDNSVFTANNAVNVAVTSGAPNVVPVAKESPSLDSEALAGQIVALKAQKEHLEAQLQGTQTSMKSEIAALKAQNVDLSSQLTAAQAALSRYEVTVDEMRQEIARLEAARSTACDDSAGEAASLNPVNNSRRVEGEEEAAGALTINQGSFDEQQAESELDATSNRSIDAVPDKATPPTSTSKFDSSLKESSLLATAEDENSDTEWGDDWG